MSHRTGVGSVLRRRAGMVALGLAVTAVMLVLTLARIPFDDARAALARARLWPWLPLASLLYLVGHVLRGWRCSLLVADEAPIGVVQGTNVVVLGYATNNVLPLRLGELVRSGMLSRVSGLPFLQSLVVTGAERLLDAGVIFALLLCSLAANPTLEVSPTTIQVSAATIGVALVCLVVVAALPGAVVRGVTRLSSVFPQSIGQALLGAALALTRGVGQLGSARRSAVVVVITLAVWLLESAMFLAVLPAVGRPADPLVAVFVMAAVNLSIIVPSSPGYIGVFHYVAMQALVLTGAPPADAFAHGVLTHLAFYAPVSVWGMAIAAWYGARLRPADLLARRDAVASAGADGVELLGVVPRDAVEAEPSPFLVALAGALGPFDQVPLDESQQADVARDVARFMQGEFDALPGTLRIALRVGLHGFSVLVTLRYLRGFCTLDVARRRALVDGWAYGGTSLNRKLFRPVRSTALLAFFEHPAVLRALGMRTAGHVLPGPVPSR